MKSQSYSILTLISSAPEGNVESLFEQSSIGQKLAAFEGDQALLFEAYALDFVRMVYKPQCTCPEEVYQV